MRRFLFLVMYIALLSTSIFQVNVYGVKNSPLATAKDFSSSDAYESYLSRLGQTQPEALKVRYQFSKLSQDKKNKLIKYINDPKILKSFFCEKMESNTRKELYGGDIVIENIGQSSEKTINEEEKISSVSTLLSSLFFKSTFAAGGIKEYTAKDIKRLKGFGIILSTYYVWVSYEVKNQKVTKIIGSGSSCDNNWIVNIKRDSLSQYIIGNKAHAYTVWQVSPVLLKNNIVDLAFVNHCWHHEVHGYPNGTTTYSWWKN